MEKEVKQTWFFKQSPKEVWKYLTTPELIAQWLTENDFAPKAGHKFQFKHRSGKIVYCEVKEVEPFTKLIYTWKFPSAVDGKAVDSKIEWTLVQKENGTELHLLHNGFTFLEDVTGHTKGWNICIDKFTELINAK
jgi:uncharacterized protein YndB with AHSA1/START domain